MRCDSVMSEGGEAVGGGELKLRETGRRYLRYPEIESVSLSGELIIF